jgi:PAS domain S-box-containing protein
MLRLKRLGAASGNGALRGPASENEGNAGVKSLVQRLQVQQIEFEIQNEDLRRAQEELAASRERYRALYEEAPVGYLRLDRQGHILEANHKAAEILHTDSERLVGARLSNFLAPESLSDYHLHRRAVLADGHRHACELTVRADDAWRAMHVESTLAAAGRDEPQGLRCVLADITPRKHAEQELADLNAELEERVRERAAELAYREQQLSAILQTAPSAVVTVGVDGHIQQMNGAAERMFGYGEVDVVGRPFALLVADPSLSEAERWCLRQANSQTDAPGSIEVRGRLSDGSTTPAELAVAKLTDYGIYVAILHDLSEPKRLLSEVLNAAEEERMRISVDLHDGVSQQLAGLAMTARTLTRRLEAAGSAEAEALSGFSTALNDAMEDVRRVVQGLVPLGLDTEDLPGALERLAENTTAETGIPCYHRRCGPQLDPPEEQTRLQLLRIASEAVHNAVKHASATSIEIALERGAEGLTLSVCDDGRGFDEVSGNASDPAGVGLRIMRYRAQLIGADFRAERAAWGGVGVRCVLRE